MFQFSDLDGAVTRRRKKERYWALPPHFSLEFVRNASIMLARTSWVDFGKTTSVNDRRKLARSMGVRQSSAQIRDALAERALVPVGPVLPFHSEKT